MNVHMDLFISELFGTRAKWLQSIFLLGFWQTVLLKALVLTVHTQYEASCYYYKFRTHGWLHISAGCKG